MYKTDSLVALSLFFLVVGASAGLKTFLEVFKGAVELIALLKVDGDYLVNSDELTGDLSLDLSQA